MTLIVFQIKKKLQEFKIFVDTKLMLFYRILDPK